MEKQEIIAFFDRLAPLWDADQVPRDQVLNRILDNARIGEGQTVLDVACGTGIMIPYYLQRKAAAVTGIDISPEMVKLAQQKFCRFPQVKLVCGDVEEASFPQRFDRVVVHNALPHFSDPERLIKTLSGMVKPGGLLAVAHSFSRAHINKHHEGSASKVSRGLISADALKTMFEPYFEVEVVISDDVMYQVCGKRK